jgi:hypothetical protein
MATPRSAITRHANTGVIKIDGEAIAEAVGVSYRESGGTDPTHVVGDAHPKEHVHNRYSVTVTVQRLVFKRGALNRFGPEGVSLLALDPVTIQGLDDVDGKVLFNVLECTLTDRDMNVNANSRIQGNLTFQGTKVVPSEGQAPRFPNSSRA